MNILRMKLCQVLVAGGGSATDATAVTAARPETLEQDDLKNVKIRSNKLCLNVYFRQR